MAKNKENTENLEGLNATRERSQIFLKDHKKEHFNFAPKTDYKVSTNSIKLDMILDGGLGPGIQRLCGITEGGKTSFALLVAANFQKTVPNSFVVYVKAEGRLSDVMLKRSGIDTSENRFLVLSTNQFECVFNYIKEMVLQENNTEKTKFCFIIDSLDSLDTADNKDKKFGESQKVASGAAINTVFTRQMSLPMNALGHMLILISQQRNSLNIKSYTGPTTIESGGFAVKHFSNNTLEFKQRYESDFIYENSSAASRAAKGNRIGHFCKIIFKKSDDEKTGTSVSYPIKYGRTDGNSVWKEYEILRLLETWKMFESKGAGWINFTPDTLELLNKASISLDEKTKWQGEVNFLEFFEQNPNVTNFFADYFKNMLNKDFLTKDAIEDDSISDSNG